MRVRSTPSLALVAVLALAMAGCQATASPSTAAGDGPPGVAVANGAGRALDPSPPSTAGSPPDEGSSAESPPGPSTVAPAPSPIAPAPSPAPPTPEPTSVARAPRPSSVPVGASRPAAAPLVPIGFTLHVPILTYHLIDTPAGLIGPALPDLVVSPALFDAQLSRLASAGWHTITLRQLAADLAAHRRPARRTFVITIDDGHVDGFTQAFPVLQRHHMTATYFVIARRIGRTGYLDASQLRALAAAGMEIADHSMTHVDLAALPPDRLRGEVAGAAGILASVVGTAPKTFAYPFGRFDAATTRAVAGARLQLAVTTQPGAVEAANLRYRIPRLHVGPGTTPAMLLAMVRRYAGR